LRAIKQNENENEEITTPSFCVILRILRETKPRHPSALFCEFCGKLNHAILLRFSANSAGNKTTQSFCVFLRILRETKPRHPSAFFCEFSFDLTHGKCGKQNYAIQQQSSAGNISPFKFIEIRREMFF
jgi:hypothetical protein